MALAIYAALAVLFYAIAKDQLRTRTDSTDSVSPSASTGEILAGTRLEQQFTVQSDRLTGFSVLCGTFGRQNSGKLHMALYEQTDSDEKILIEDFAVDVSHMQDNAWQVMQLTEPLENAAGKNLLLEVSSPDGVLGNAVTVYYGDSVSAGRVEVASEGWTPLAKTDGKRKERYACARLGKQIFGLDNITGALRQERDSCWPFMVGDCAVWRKKGGPVWA